MAHTVTAAEQCSIDALITRGIPESTARTIAMKVHAHDELVAALCDCLSMLDDCAAAARVALAKVEA